MANPNPKLPPKESSPWRRDMHQKRFSGDRQPDANSTGSKQARDILDPAKLPKKPPGKQ